MLPSPRLRARLVLLERTLGPRCHACAHRPLIDDVLFRYNGVLQTSDGRSVDEADLLACPACGKGPSEWLKVVVNVDPACV